MGYDFYAYNRKKDEESLYSTACMYAYEPIFKKYTPNGEDITYFNGVVSKKKIKEFEEFLRKFKASNHNNLDSNQMRGYMGNISYERLVKDFECILTLMEDGECKYFSVG